MTMDCRNCQPILVDLLYGELATDAADAARAHLRTCASCRAAYEKLAAGLRVARTLEIVEPPARVEPKLLELAHARVLAIAEQRAAATPPPPSAWRVAVDFITRFAMARQVGMVTISLLIVAVGLWSLPQVWRRPVANVPASAAVPVAQQVAEEAAPSDGVKPADRLGLKMDTHGRILRSTDDEAASIAQSKSSGPGAVGDRVARDVDKSAARVQGAEPRMRRAYPAAHARSEAPVADRAAGANEPLLSPYRSDPGSPRPAVAARPFPASTPAPLGSARKKTAPEADMDERLAEPALGQASGSGAPQPAREAEGKAKVSSPTSMAAAPPPDLRAPAGTLAAQLAAASAVARRDGCAAALGRYQAIVAAGGTTSEAGQALLEIARCQTSLGQTASARQTLARAVQNPAVAPRARSMLSALDAAAPATGGASVQDPTAAPGMASPPHTDRTR
jgi:hypothetical protein